MHRLLLSMQKLRDSVRPAGRGTSRGRGRRPNPWPKCPACFRRVPNLCLNVDDEGGLCEVGKACGCCPGHRPRPRPADDDGRTS